MERAKSICESSSEAAAVSVGSGGRGSRGGGTPPGTPPPSSPSSRSSSSDWGEGVRESTAGTGGRARLPGGTDLFRFLGSLKSDVEGPLPWSCCAAGGCLKWKMLVNVLRRDLIFLRPPGRSEEEDSSGESFMVTSSRCCCWCLLTLN